MTKTTPTDDSDAATELRVLESPTATHQPYTRPRAATWLSLAFGWIDRLFNRIYGSPWNPLYQSGALAVLFLLVTIISGLYMFLFYSVSDPYESVRHMVDDVWLGSWARSVHRYAGDLAVVAVAVHAVKIFVAGRNWGPRALAWIVGSTMVGLLMLCGWTGFIMVWDRQAHLVAVELARILDILPIFSEPISRSFVSDTHLPKSFFFMNLFLHVALPLGIAAMLWLHVARVARPRLMPPRAMTRYALAVLFGYAWLVPAPMLARADLLEIPANVPIDLFYGFWVPLAAWIPPAGQLAFWTLLGALAITVPWWWRPRRHQLKPSMVDESRCTGCTQCYEDCPYDAITMVRRREPSNLSELVARVDSDLCVSCGICAGSCAPMSIGPPMRTGAAQIRQLQHFLDQQPPEPDQVVLMACGNGLGSHPELSGLAGIVPYPVGCLGAVHSFVIETLLRRGTGGVYLLGCPHRDAQYREGATWAELRLFHDREAELKARVDKRRVRLATFAATEVEAATADLAAFVARIRALDGGEAEEIVTLDLECDPPAEAHHG